MAIVTDCEINALFDVEDAEYPLGKYGKVLWLTNLVRVAAQPASMIVAHPWKVVHASRDLDFVTSDSPIIRVASSGQPVRIGPVLSWVKSEV